MGAPKVTDRQTQVKNPVNSGGSVGGKIANREAGSAVGRDRYVGPGCHENLPPETLPEFVEVPIINRASMIKHAVLEGGAVTDCWLATVRRHLAKMDPKENRGVAALKAIRLAYVEFKIKFTLGPADPSGPDPNRLTDIQPPKMILMTRLGRCTDNTLLVSATLRALGLPFAMIMTPAHIVPAVILSEKEAANYDKSMVSKLTRLPEDGQAEEFYFMPMDLNRALGKDDTFEKVVQIGAKFVTEKADKNPDGLAALSDGRFFIPGKRKTWYEDYEMVAPGKHCSYPYRSTRPGFGPRIFDPFAICIEPANNER